MSHTTDRWRELDLLMDRLLDGLQTEADTRRLNVLLRSDPDACRRYVGYVEVHGRLSLGEGNAKAHGGRSGDASGGTGSASGTQAGETPGDGPLLHRSSVTVHPFVSWGALVSAYAAASLILAISVLIARTWDESARRAVVRNGPRPTPSLARLAPDQDAVVGRITALADCRWADPATAAENLETFGAGRKFALASGLLKISYRVGAIVVLQGPACYEADSVAGGTLKFGKLTVNLSKDPSAFMPVVPLGVPPFSVRTPTALVNVASRPGSLGLEVERSGVSCTHVFWGAVTLDVAGRETGRVQTVPLGEGQVARVQESAAARVVTCMDHAAAPDSFAQFVVMPAAALANAGRWLKGLHADPGVPLIAVGSEPERDVARQAERDWTPVTSEAPRTGNGVIETCRVNFKISDLVPATVVLRGRFAAADQITAMRLNGVTLQPLSRNDENAVGRSGVFAMRCGFVEGENVWEIDVDGRTPNSSLIVRPQLSGIHAPSREELAKPVRGDPGSERIIEVR
jgi:hypothetical protein